MLSPSSNARPEAKGNHGSFDSVSLARDCAQDDSGKFGSVLSQVRKSGPGAPWIGGTENGAWNASPHGANRLAARRESVHRKDRFQVSGVRRQLKVARCRLSVDGA